ncbi:MAG TPA: DUF2207 domain-containing protein, partial [Acidimicrobiales bacterium]
MNRVARLLAAIAIVAAPLLFFTAPPAAADGCDWTATDTDATVNPDASMDVVEHVTYDFTGTCHGGIRQLNLSGGGTDDTVGATQYTISPITVTENGEPSPIAQQGP